MVGLALGNGRKGRGQFLVGLVYFVVVPILLLHSHNAYSATHQEILRPASFQHYFNEFAEQEYEMLGTHTSLPWEWFVNNIPWLDVPDKNIEEIYYFRWYAFQKHIKCTPDGYVIDEFLDPMPWTGKFNTIDAAAGHHIREARWLRDSEYVDDYTRFWFGPDGEPRQYSFWGADSVYQLYLSTGNKTLAIQLLPSLVRNYEAWEDSHQDANGLFWQIDDRDGMEDSISGTGYRPTINSYMYGDAVAISHIAEMANQGQLSERFKQKAERLREIIETHLWNPHDQFYETVRRHTKSQWTGGRELIGYIPWYFDIPPADHDAAWKQILDSNGFKGRYGLTTAERRNPRFDFTDSHECLWNGPSWPYATTQTLVALANLLNGPEQKVVNSEDYFDLFNTYALAQHIRLPNGKTIPWIDEDFDADTDVWLARNILAAKHQPPANRGRYYNHSGFADLVITGLIGLRPEEGNDFVIHPLLPQGKWAYFALEGVPYHGHLMTIVYDRDGSRYHLGAGLQVLCDGKTIAHAATLQTLHVILPKSQ